MDARARFAAGGFFAGAAAIAVVGVVAMSNSTTLADVPGASAGIAPVRVAAAAARTATPIASPTTSAVKPAPVHTTETVPAPDPAILTPPSSVAAAPEEDVEGPSEATEDALVADASRSGSWHDARRWAEDHGWTQEAVDEWVAKLEAELNDWRDATAERWYDTTAEQSAPQTPADAGTPSGHEHRFADGLKRDRSHVSPDGD